MNEAVFKTTVVGGFSKSDVLEFIDKQDAQFKEREKDLVTRIDSLSTGLKNETQHSAQLLERIADLENQLEDEKKMCAEAVQKSREANNEAGEVKNGMNGEIERRDAGIDRLKIEACELTRKTNEAEAKASDAVARAAALEDKLNLIDKTEEQIGRAMLEAQQTADKIIGFAKKEAEELLAKTSEDTDNLIEQAKENVQNINSSAQKKIDVLLYKVAEYKKRVTDTRAETTSFFNTVDSVLALMNNNAEDVLKKFTNAFTPKNEPIAPNDEETACKEVAAAKFDFSTDSKDSD